MDGDSYYAAGPYTKNSVNSVNIAQGALRFSGFTGNQTVTYYNASGNVGTFTTNRGGNRPNYYYRNPQFTLNRTDFVNNDMVYFSYGTGTNIRYSTEAYSIATLTSKTATNYITVTWQTTPPTF